MSGRAAELLRTAGWVMLRGLAVMGRYSMPFGPAPLPPPYPEITRPAVLASRRPPPGHPDRDGHARLSPAERRRWRRLAGAARADDPPPATAPQVPAVRGTDDPHARRTPGARRKDI